ncbi:hypothetical protein MEQU1_003239 [Malassezia equina]|uniref:Dynactin subunit 6 n=1 Tax=Malassezia equina TaxID=1381935 RepID=A0AAF0EDR5_9BASI|nr:hypothetical protein MEQU1_003239 [Malassezia equina]
MPPEPITIHPKVVVPADVDIRGTVTIKTGTVLHPRVKLDGSLAPLVVGENCILEEGVQLTSGANGLQVGDGNWLRVGCRIASDRIGNCNVFEVGCHVPAHVRVSNFCVVGAGCDLQFWETTELLERTVVYGAEAAQRTWSGDGIGQQLASHAKHLQYLRTTLPQHHKLRIFRS